MNPLPAQPTTTTTFILRFWREWTGTESHWRGRVEHVQSGQQASFMTISDLLAFLFRFGIDATVAGESEDNRPPWLDEPDMIRSR